MNYRATIGAWTVVGIVLAMMTANPTLTALVAGTWGFVILVTWRPGEFPALTFACLMQWLAASMTVLRADVEGVEIWRLAYARPRLDDACMLSLLAIMAFATSARVAFGWQANPLPQEYAWAPGLDRRLVLMWLAGNLVAAFLATVYIPGFAQVTRAAKHIKWVPVLLIFFAVLSRGRNYRLLVIVLATEIAMGFLSFFSAFKQPLFLLALAFVGAQRGRRLSPRQIIGAGTVGVFAIALGLVWTAIKVEYREYVSAGTGTQVVAVSTEDQVNKFFELVDGIDQDMMRDAGDLLVNRIAYVNYFSAALDYVPAIVPFEQGGRTVAALKHVFQPRLFFPKKDVLNDTFDTERYTGLSLESDKEATSISLGYPAEAYIDAGPTFMFLPIAFFGTVYGLLARYFARRRDDPLLGQALAVITFLTVSTLELGFTKMLGGSITLVVTFALLWRFLVPRLSPWLWGTSLAQSTPSTLSDAMPVAR